MGSRPRYLTLEQVEEIVNNWSDSEDEFDEEDQVREDNVYEEVEISKIAEEFDENVQSDVVCSIASEPTYERFNIEDMEIIYADDIPKFSDSITALNELKQIKEKCARIIWKNKDFQISELVTLVSAFVGKNPLHISTRREKNVGSLNVECPSIVKEYNKFMGGVDLLDANLGWYKIKMRSKKWYIRVFYHMLDVTAANAWILYKRVEKQRGTSDREVLGLADFKTELSETLMKFAEPLRAGRPSRDINDRINLKRKTATAAQLPPKEIRLDNIGHIPHWTDKRFSCKLPGCNKLGFISCSKCNIQLCLNKDRNCYEKFHS